MTNSGRCEVQWLGPYRWYGPDQEVLFSQLEAHQAGIYVWTVEYRDGYLTYYVGETGRSVHRRSEEHVASYLNGLYRVYDPSEFRRGVKTLVWEGMWKRGTEHRMGEFLNRYPELSSVIHEFLGLFRIFIAPLDADQRTRERIEAAIAGCLYEQPGIIGGFQENDAVYRHRRPDEEPIAVLLRLPKPILGLRTELIG